MNLLRQAWLGCLLVASPAWGSCAFSVAYLGAGPDAPPPIELIRQTHRKLLEVLKDPDVLSKRLHDFEKMLQKKNWLTPAVMQALFESGSAHYGGQAVAQAVVKEAVGENEKLTLHFPTEHRGQRRWIQFPSPKGGIELADLQTGLQIHIGTLPNGWSSEYIAVSEENDTIAVAKSYGVGLRTYKSSPGSPLGKPLAEIERKRGLLDWPFSQFSKARLTELRPGPEPHQWLASYLYPDGVFLFDTKAGTVKMLSRKFHGVALEAPHTWPNWNRVPGTRDYYISGDTGFEDHSARKELISATLLPDGKFGRPHTWIVFSGISGEPTYAFAHDGNSVFKKESDKVVRIGRDGKSTDIPFDPPADWFHIHDLHATADGKFLDILVRTKPFYKVGRRPLAGGKTEWVDVFEDKPGIHRIYFTEDGKRVVFGTSGGNITSSHLIVR